MIDGLELPKGRGRRHGGAPRGESMSRHELLRLIKDAKQLDGLSRQLHRCASWQELGRTAQLLGYGISAEDLSTVEQQSKAADFLREARLRPIARLS